MRTWFLKPNTKTAFFKAILQFCTANQLFKYFLLCVCVIDNAAIHHSQAAIDAIHATEAMVIFLPPYSPDLIPLKELCAQVKNWIKENDAAWQFCRDPALMIEEAFLQVTEEVRNYIKHAEYF